ncbi:MAG: DNA-binding protein [Acidobacteriota bacterium]|nr:DNA-binding protein [Acidobacteriota bacterium]
MAVLVAAPALAQAGGRARLYNTATETTLQGTVSAVTNPVGRRGQSGTHLSLQSGGQTYDVHVGPSTYIANAGFTFAAGDRIEVTGSKVQLNGADAIIAREITKDGKLLTLRDKQGFPKWSGGRRNAQ